MNKNNIILDSPRADIKSKATSDVCTECGSKMVPEGGCFVCLNCGYSPCHI